jgi:hypothetical protein
VAIPNPPAFGFSAEYLGDTPAFDGFDDYLRDEFAERHPDWEPTFGKVTRYDPSVNRYDYLYLLHGSVPDAESHEDAEKKVRQLIDEFSRGLKGLESRVGKAIPRPRVKVWRWRP